MLKEKEWMTLYTVILCLLIAGSENLSMKENINHIEESHISFIEGNYVA